MCVSAEHSIVTVWSQTSSLRARDDSFPLPRPGGRMETHIRKIESSRKRFLSKIVAIMCVLAFTIGGASAANADYFAGGMPSKKNSVKYVGINSTYVNQFNNARFRWNALSGVTFGKSNSAKNTMTAARYSSSWYGLYTSKGPRNNSRTFTIQVNVRSLQAASGGNMSKWIASTSAHELGHALSLKDNPNTSKSSLMKHSRNRSTAIGPQSYDVSEVKRIY